MFTKMLSSTRNNLYGYFLIHTGDFLGENSTKLRNNMSTTLDVVDEYTAIVQMAAEMELHRGD